ncbi:MAG: thioredoxin domain-containing protein [Saprospiraceae bacterium]|nr:thioredoxin domain-containing protein [Saprospiraceae bacterium]
MNHLQYETSPYLLQHAKNPVDWYAWKPAAFERARLEDKPILVSIGYSTCHWCHVMEHESFENEQIAAFMNTHFINIKVDREERPDVDQIYMEACQFISGSGGWPLNCFLTPDGRPFFAGTYYPPQQAYNRPAWMDVLKHISTSFRERRKEVEAQANQLVGLIEKSDDRLFGQVIEGLTPSQVFTPVTLQNISFNLLKRADTTFGGFGGGLKFPSSMSLRYLLHYHFFTLDVDALKHVELSLDKMIQGGIYDQLGGGFARYATDREWLIPHFEKMLYDNALLIRLLCEVYQLTGKAIYRETIEETLTYVQREMISPEGGFYAAQDADSEGVEGKFYVWSKAEIEELLGEEAALFNDFYGVSEIGNWENVNILWREQTYEQYAQAKQLEVEELKLRLKSARAILFAARNQRIYPGLDDKILLDWNALMCAAFAQAYQTLGTPIYKEIAQRNIDFLLTKLKQSDTIALFHTYKNGQAQYDAFLNDYAFLIDALLEVYHITFETKYLDKALLYNDFVLVHFFDDQKNAFYFTSAQQQDIIMRKIDLYDSALPSGNSTMVHNLQRLSILFDQPTYRNLAASMLMNVQSSVEQYASSFSLWAMAIMNEVHAIPEIAILGNNAFEMAMSMQRHFLPNKVLMISTTENDNYPLLKGKPLDTTTQIYICKNYACQQPVEHVSEALKNVYSS